MDLPARDELERRMHARVSDWLDLIAADNPDGFDIGVSAFIGEVFTAGGAPEQLRVDGAYTPEGTSAHFSYFCSDSRRWVKQALYRAAAEFYDASGEEDEYEFRNDYEENAE